jgi:hypothetical protein
MRKILFAVLMCMAFVGCTKGSDVPEIPEPQPTPEMVTFSINVQMPTTGNMTRSASEIYDNFYSAYIQNKKLLPEEYSLTFYKGSEKVGSFSGKWDAEFITLPEGTYKVVGTCTGKWETMTLRFEEDINITKGMKNITLTAIYDCYLLMFDTQTFSYASMQYMEGSAHTGRVFAATDEVHYMFINGTEGKLEDIEYRVAGTKNEGSVDVNVFSFEKGKYYFFELINGTVTIPQMQQGN